MPVLTMASAISRISLSLTSHPNLFQLFQPIGGVAAMVADCALAVCGNKPLASRQNIASTSRAVPACRQDFLAITSFTSTPSFGRADYTVSENNLPTDIRRGVIAQGTSFALSYLGTPMGMSPKVLNRRATRDGGAFGGDIVASQLPQRVRHEFGSDFLPPAHIEVGVVQRFSDARSERGSFRDGFGTERTTHKKSPCFLGKERTRSCGADDDASVFNHAAPTEARGGGHGQDGEIEGSAAA